MVPLYWTSTIENFGEQQYVVIYSLFRNKGFLVNLKTEKNASKFAMFMEKENPCSFFVFHLEQLSFSPYECPGLC